MQKDFEISLSATKEAISLVAAEVAFLVSDVVITDDGEVLEQDSPDTLKSLATKMSAIKSLLDMIDGPWKDLTKKYDELRLRKIPDLMAELEMRSANIEGIGRVGLTSDVYASIVSSEIDPSVKERAYTWLKENGYDGIVVEYIHPSTFKAVAKEWVKEGVEYPDDLFNVKPFMRASITKTK